MSIEELVEKSLKKAAALRHELHQNPELSWQERGTMDRILAFLREETNLEVMDKGTWLYARKRGEGSSPIAFRADMDALPIQEASGLPYASCREGVMHACGHDGHMAALCAFALCIDQLQVGRDIYFIFQPAEEIGEGAKACVGLLKEEGIGQVYAFHNRPGFPLGTVVIREGVSQPPSEGVTLSFLGKKSHASEPELGRNPSRAVASVILFLQELESFADGDMRSLATLVGVKVGTGDFGISPDQGEVRVTLRAISDLTLQEAEGRLLAFARAEAEREGLGFSFGIQDAFPQTCNDPSALIKVRSVCEALGIPQIPMTKLWRASEDFGYYLYERPGAMVYIGAGEDAPALHTSTYDFPDQILGVAVRLFLGLVGIL